MIDNLSLNVSGHVKIWDPTSGEVLVSKHNAINSETMSLLIAKSLVSNDTSYIAEMHFGNGGAIIDATGNITYRDVTTNLEAGQLAGLFNPTYFKVVDVADEQYNTEPEFNNVVASHTEGLNYTDVIITCTLGQDQPNINEAGNLQLIPQEMYDNAANFDGEFIFSELGLKSKGSSGDPNTGDLLSHIVFHPVQKSANRVIQVVYTLRIRIV